MRDFSSWKARPLSLVIMVAVAVAGCIGTGAIAETLGPPQKLRVVEFTYHTDVTGIDTKAHQVEIWIPLPRIDRFQSVTGLTIDSPVRAEVVEQPANGNRVAHLSAIAPLPAKIPVTIRFKVWRVEESADLHTAQRNVPEPRDGTLSKDLGPDRLVPINGQILTVSAKVGSTGAPAFEQAQAIYNYVIANMKYDKSGTGWGRGDAIYACNVRKGNCTDFHSLFIAIARSRGIPARFTIGFPLGPAPAGKISGYHCWAEFYSAGVWVPVDASEAWKHPDRHTYYFGNLDADRVAFTMGRDLVLKPPQRGEPLNFLIYPYVEVDGKPLPKENIKNQFDYRDSAVSN